MQYAFWLMLHYLFSCASRGSHCSSTQIVSSLNFLALDHGEISISFLLIAHCVKEPITDYCSWQVLEHNHQFCTELYRHWKSSLQSFLVKEREWGGQYSWVLSKSNHCVEISFYDQIGNTHWAYTSGPLFGCLTRWANNCYWCRYETDEPKALCHPYTWSSWIDWCTLLLITTFKVVLLVVKIDVKYLILIPMCALASIKDSLSWFHFQNHTLDKSSVSNFPCLNVGDETLRFWTVFPSPRSQGGSNDANHSFMRTQIRWAMMFNISDASIECCNLGLAIVLSQASSIQTEFTQVPALEGQSHVSQWKCCRCCNCLSQGSCVLQGFCISLICGIKEVQPELKHISYMLPICSAFFLTQWHLPR